MSREKLLENDTICKNVLYPYGKIVTKKIINPQFPTNIQICKWCNQKPHEKTQPCKLDEIIVNNCNVKKKNKEHSLCESEYDSESCDNNPNSSSLNVEFGKVLKNIIEECKLKKSNVSESHGDNSNLNVELVKVMKNLIEECNLKKKNEFELHNNTLNINPNQYKEENKVLDKNDCNCKNKRKNCNLCKNARPLFI
jgi:hypothetical protein